MNQKWQRYKEANNYGLNHVAKGKQPTCPPGCDNPAHQGGYAIGDLLEADGNGYRVEPPGEDVMPRGSSVKLVVGWDYHNKTLFVHIGRNRYEPVIWASYEDQIRDVITSGRLWRFRYFGSYLMLDHPMDEIGVERMSRSWGNPLMVVPWLFWNFKGLELSADNRYREGREPEGEQEVGEYQDVQGV